MKEDDACKGILAEMIAFGIIEKEKKKEAFPYLKLIYGLGHDEGNTQPSKRTPVIQYSLHGEPIKIWEALKHAAAFYKISPRTIAGAIKGKWPTAAGYKWKFVTKEFTSSEPNAEQSKSESARPRSKTHSSKKA